MTEERIKLWRNAVRQFKKYREIEGAFYKAGYTNFEIEREFKDLIGKTITPDIVGWSTIPSSAGNNRYFIFELTLKDELKEEQLGKYSIFSPSAYSAIGIQSEKLPDVILGTLHNIVGQDDYCQMIFGEKLDVKFSQHVIDPMLRDSIKNCVNMDLVEVPEISFRLVPESKSGEIRRGIVSSIMQAFMPGNEQLTTEEVMKQGLDILYEKTGIVAKRKLSVNISKEIDTLVSKHLQDYLEKVSDGVYKLTDKGKTVHETPNSRLSVNSKIEDWVNSKQSSLSEF